MVNSTSKTIPFLVLSAVLSVVFLGQTRLAQRAWSITFDETFYLNCALQTVQDGRVDPRLSRSGVGALPILLTNVPAAWTAPRSDRPGQWTGDLDHPPLNRIARRLNTLLIGIPLILLVTGWLLCRRGFWAATLGGVMMAFSPTIVAHASLASTDACSALFCLLSLAVLARWFNNPTRLNFLFAAACIGLAISAKYSGVFLFPVAGVLLAFETWPHTTGSLHRRFWKAVLRTGKRLCVLVAVAMMVLWATDGFSFSGPLKTVPLDETPDDSPWVQILGNGPLARRIMDYSHRELRRPTVVAALIERWLHNKSGHSAYLLGEHSRTGWSWYFPCAWLWKSTPAELLLSVLILPLLWVVRRTTPPDDPKLARTRWVWLIALGIYWLMVCSARVNIGHRYLLPLYPLTFLLAVDLMWLAWRDRPRRLLVVGVILASVQIASALWVSPHYLAYFSPLIGGPEKGRHYLVDSNLDWGQDLPALQQELEIGGYQRPLLEYFGTAEPEAYGVKAAKFSDVALAELDGFDVLALSVTKLQGDYLHPHDPFQGFRNLTPTLTAGYSIFLYDLSDPGVRALLREAWERYPPAARTAREEVDQSAKQPFDPVSIPVVR